MNKIIKSLAGDTIWYGMGSILPRVLNFLLFRIHTDVFHPDEYGALTSLMSLMAALNVVCSFGMETTFFRYCNNSLESPQKTFHVSQTIVTLISGIVCGGLWVGQSEIALMLNIPKYEHFIPYLGVILFIDSLVIIPFARLRQEKKRKLFVAFKLSNIVVLIALNLIFLWGIYDPRIGIGYILIANIAANALYLIFFYKDLLSWRPQLPKAYVKNMFTYAYPIMLTGLAGITNEFFSRLALNRWLPPNFYPGRSSEFALGVFGGAYKFAVLMLLAIQTFRFAAEPFFFSHAQDKKSPQLFAQINHFFTIVCCFIMLGVSINVDILKYIFLKNPDYWDGLRIVPTLLLGYIFSGIYYNLTVWFKLTDRTYFGTIITVGGMLITILLNLLLIPRFGYAGSAWVSVAAYGTMSAACYLLGQVYYPIPYRVWSGLLYIVVTFIGILLIDQINFNNLAVNVVFRLSVMAAYAAAVWRIEKKNWRLSSQTL